MLVAAAIGMYLFGEMIGLKLFQIMVDFLTLDPNRLMDPVAMLHAFSAISDIIALPLIGFITFLCICAFLGNVIIGGATFSSVCD